MRTTYNRERVRKITINKTIIGSWVAATTFNNTYEACWRFDPAGTNATHNGGPGSITNVAIPDWTAAISMYTLYRVNYVKMTFRVSATVDTPGLYPVMWSRYMYDADFPQTSVRSNLQAKPNVVMTTFSDDNKLATFKVYPRIQQGASFFTLSSLPEGFYPVKMPYIDCTRPVALFGFAWTATIPNGFSMTVDVQYNVSFKKGR
jgi:hypothetical protein